MVFFVSASQKLLIERALALASQNIDEKTKTAGRATALYTIAKSFINQKVNSAGRATALYTIAKSFINQKVN